jgi:hypothetical protein
MLNGLPVPSVFIRLDQTPIVVKRAEVEATGIWHVGELAAHGAFGRSILKALAQNHGRSCVQIAQAGYT